MAKPRPSTSYTVSTPTPIATFSRPRASISGPSPSQAKDIRHSIASLPSGMHGWREEDGEDEGEGESGEEEGETLALSMEHLMVSAHV